MIENVVEADFPSKSVVRDRTQIYNARRPGLSLNKEYLTVMKLLEDPNSVISRFAMVRGEAPIILLSKTHQMQELRRCCDISNTQTSPSVLCKLYSVN